MIQSTKIKIIGSNFTSEDENWRKVLRNPDIYVDTRKLGRKAFLLRKKVENALKTEKIALAWSGGKDSVVLRHILRGLHFTEIQFATFTKMELYFPDTQLWFEEHSPIGVEKFDMGIDRKRLSNIMFPATAIEVKCWLTPKWKIFLQRQKALSLDWTLFGRRKDDGNKIVREKFVSKKGMKTWCPMMNWTNEDIAAYIAVHNVVLPPDYMIEGGFKFGLCVWPLTSMEVVKARWPALIGTEVSAAGKLIL